VRSPVVKLAFFLLSISFVLASLRGWYSFHPLVRLFYVCSAVWLGFASCFLVAASLTWVGYGLVLLLGGGWSLASIAGVFLAVAVVVAFCGMSNAAWPRATRISIHLSNLPPQWRGRTAALVSDLHLGHVRNRRFVRRVVRAIAALRPDIVFVAGDLYDGVAADFEKLAQPWTDLVSSHSVPLGVCYIAGNHEEFYRQAEYLPPLLRSGVRVLDNEKIEVDGLQIVGVHYRDAANPERYRSILRSLRLDRNRASVLLLHAPVRPLISEEEGISLQLSGHTHGGQFFPWTLVARRVWGRFNHGLQNAGKMQAYITYGAGTWGPPLRVGTRPEVVLITFA